MLVKHVLQITGPLLLSALVFGATTASAHHSFAMFDQTKNVTVEGTVKNVDYANPACLGRHDRHERPESARNVVV